jgi:hypothetical protein
MSLLRRDFLVLAAWMSALLLICSGSTAVARPFNVLTFVSMIYGGRPVANSELSASYVALVMAAKHFNERNASILSVLSQLGKCDATLNLVGGLFDDEVLSSVAMPHLIGALSTGSIDFINGPLGADVRGCDRTCIIS